MRAGRQDTEAKGGSPLTAMGRDTGLEALPAREKRWGRENSLHFVQCCVLFGHLHHVQGCCVRQGVVAQVELLEVLVRGQVLSNDLGTLVPQCGVQQGQMGQRAVACQCLGQVLCPLLAQGVICQPVDTEAQGNAKAGQGAQGQGSRWAAETVSCKDRDSTHRRLLTTHLSCRSRSRISLQASEPRLLSCRLMQSKTWRWQD